MKTIGALIITISALAAVPTAQAASAPAVGTGAAVGVGFSSATLTGTVNPKGIETLYYFQYGLTRAYTAQTGLLDAGAGRAALHVSIGLPSLAPLTAYHYRLVAVNGAGRSVGADKAFITSRVPLSLAILASPDPVPFGGAVTIQGTLSGTGNGDREVVLQADGFPFTAGFANVENPELTTATGGFSFHVLGLTAGTLYRVVTATSRPVISPVVGEAVVPIVSAHARRLRAGLPHGRRLVRFSGTVAPALDGMHIAIMRMTHGRSVFVAGGSLRHSSVQRSRFARVLRVRRGIYRVLVQVGGGALISTYSEPLLVR